MAIQLCWPPGRFILEKFPATRESRGTEASPAFCDSEVDYYDAAGNIRRLYEHSLTGRGREEAERCIAAMEEYLSGRGPGNIQLQLENSLYYPDRFFQTAAEVERDMEQPGPVDFRRFFLEIYGDG